MHAIEEGMAWNCTPFFNKRNIMEEKKNIVPMGAEKQGAEKEELHNRTGSTDHNDYRISGLNDAAEKNESESYQDYNGNSDAAAPERS